MKPRHARCITRLYPRRWRTRYASEFEALLEATPPTPRTVLNAIRSAVSEYLFPTYGNPMQQPSFGAMLKHPSAFIPVAMSLIALSVLFANLALYGVVHEADEGAVAHIWQILMAGQLPVLLFFAVKWLPRFPRPTLYVLAVQAAAICASVAPVLYYKL